MRVARQHTWGALLIFSEIKVTKTPNIPSKKMSATLHYLQRSFFLSRCLVVLIKHHRSRNDSNLEFTDEVAVAVVAQHITVLNVVLHVGEVNVAILW